MENNTYRIQMTPAAQHPCEHVTYPTLEAAREALRKANGGALYGSFDLANEFVGEGWNLAAHDGCDTAAILMEVA